MKKTKPETVACNDAPSNTTAAPVAKQPIVKDAKPKQQKGANKPKPANEGNLCSFFKGTYFIIHPIIPPTMKFFGRVYWNWVVRQSVRGHNFVCASPPTFKVESLVVTPASNIS